MNIMLRKRLVKKKEKNISERRDPATTTATADPGRASREQRAVTKVVVAALAVFSFSLRTERKRRRRSVSLQKGTNQPATRMSLNRSQRSCRSTKYGTQAKT